MELLLLEIFAITYRPFFKNKRQDYIIIILLKQAAGCLKYHKQGLKGHWIYIRISNPTSQIPVLQLFLTLLIQFRKIYGNKYSLIPKIKWLLFTTRKRLL